MAIEAVAEYGDPDRELTDSATLAQERLIADRVLRISATSMILGVLDEHPAAIREIKEMLCARVHLQELIMRGDAAERVVADAELHEYGLAIKLDPGGRRVLGFGLGAAAVVALMVLDAIPLNWRARPSTWTRQDLACHSHPRRRVCRCHAGVRAHPRQPQAAWLR